MATVGVKVGFDGRDVETGLQRLKGSAQSFAGDLEKKLSFKGAASSVLSGLGLASGFAVAEKAAGLIAGYWGRAAAAAQEIERASEGAMQAALARMRINETPDQEIARLEKESKNLRKTDGSEAGERLQQTVLDNSSPLIAALGRVAGLIKSPEELAVKAEQAREQAEKNDLRIAELRKARAEKDKADIAAGQALYDQLAAAKEASAMAEMTDLERANHLRDKITSLRAGADKADKDGKGEQGIRDRIEAERLVPQERAARKTVLDEMAANTIQDIYGSPKEPADLAGPAIVATSLAKIGGGGNIGVFGAGDAALAEARKASGYLQQIAANTSARGGNYITLAPASDIGN